MTRWVAQTRKNYVSVTPYNHTDTVVHGFQGTHQPAIWMGESGQVVLMPGTGTVTPAFEERGLAFNKEKESIGVSYYKVELEGNGQDDEDGIVCEMSASECPILLEETRIMNTTDFISFASRASALYILPVVFTLRSS